MTPNKIEFIRIIIRINCVASELSRSTAQFPLCIAMESSREELQNLITRCDKLKPQMEKLDEAPRKVYMKRLKMARDLYQYVLDSKSEKLEGK